MNYRPLLVVLAISLLSSGCCLDCGSGSRFGLGGLGVLEPACGIADFGGVFGGGCNGGCGPMEPNCGIAGGGAFFEPDCGMANAGGAYYEPDCGMASAGGFYGPDCGIADPCGGGCGGGCGGWIDFSGGLFGCGGGCGPFGIWNGWGPDWGAVCAGWNPCIGPFEGIASFFRCGFGGWGCGLDYGGGCGSCYWDEWASDPPRCCDPCDMGCPSSGYGHQMYGCGGCVCKETCAGGGCGGCGSSCGGPYGSGCSDIFGGYADSRYSGRGRRGAYAQRHGWPRKRNSCDGDSCQVAHRTMPRQRSVAKARPDTVASNRPHSRRCMCEQCQTRRSMAFRQQRSSNVRQVGYEREAR